MCLHLKLVQFSSNPSVIFNRQVAGWITKILKNCPSVKINFFSQVSQGLEISANGSENVTIYQAK